MEIDRLHPVRVQLRNRSRAGRAGRPAPRPLPRRRRAPCFARLRVRETGAPRLLPERATPADESAAAPCGRNVRGDRLGHRDPRGRGTLRSSARHLRRRDDLLLRRRRAGQPPSRRVRARDTPGARLGASVERAGAGEDRRLLGGRQDARRLPSRRLRALRGRPLSRQEPLALAQHPARARDPARDREGPRALSHRGRSAPHRDSRDRGHPPPGEARHRRLAARRDDRRAGAGGPDCA